MGCDAAMVTVCDDEERVLVDDEDSEQPCTRAIKILTASSSPCRVQLIILFVSVCYKP